MTSSKTDIINMALHMIGAGSISGEGSSEKQAQLAMFYYDDAIVDAITDGQFSAFLKYARLLPYNPPTEVNIITEDQQYFFPTGSWTNVFVLPNDFVLTHSFMDGMPFEIMGKVLYTNSSEAILKYYFWPSDLSAVHTKYRRCVAAYIAAYIVNELKGSIQEVSFGMQEKMLFLNEAKWYDKRNRKGVPRRQKVWGEFPFENAQQNDLVNATYRPYGESL